MRFHGLLTKARQQEMRIRVRDGAPDENAAKHFWGWVDLDEAAVACRLAIETHWQGRILFHYRTGHKLNGPYHATDT